MKQDADNKMNRTQLFRPDLRAGWSLILAFGLVLIFGPVVSAQTSAKTPSRIKAEMSRQGDSTHLEFSGVETWNYNLEPQKDGRVLLRINAMDDQSMGELKSWSDSLVPKVDVKTDGPDGQYIVEFQTGGAEVEVFDYQTDQPSRLILDFYKKIEAVAEVQPKAPAVQKKAKRSPASSAAKNMAQSDGAYQKVDRKPAGTEFIEVKEETEEGKPKADTSKQVGVFDAGDPSFDRFRIKDYQIREDAIIQSRQNIYIKFPMLKLPSSRLDIIDQEAPEYVIKPKDSKENKEARFLLTLAERKRDAAFLKSFKYFTETYPTSVYEEILRNVAADVYYRRWQNTKALEDYDLVKDQYKRLDARFPKSPLGERNAQRLAYMDLDRGDGMATIQSFEDFLKKYPDSAESDFARRAIAEGYLLIRKYEDALRTYEGLRDSKDPQLAVEAHYRLGDVHLAKEDYPKAIEAYKAALKTYPEFEKVFPNALYNLAESQFWMGNYKESLENYARYTESFPKHEHGSYSLTRIGELLEILGADRSQVMGAFLESYFRYRSSQGAEIARIRLLSQRMKGMKDKELKDAMSEMGQIARNSKLPKMSEFVTLMTADGLYRRNENEKAIDYLISYYQKNPTSVNQEFFRQRILRNMSEILRSRVAKEQFLPALQFQSSYANTWLKNNGRIDIPYFIGRAYEQAGVLPEAKNYYGAVLTQLQQIKGKAEEKERKVVEHLPEIEAVQLRLASLDVANRKYQEAFDRLTEITRTEALTDAEQIERVQLAAKVYEEKGEIEKAKIFVRNLIGAWKGNSSLLPPVYLKLAELEDRTGNTQASLDALNQIPVKSTEEQPVPTDVLAKSLELKGDLLVKLKKPLAAVEIYMDLLAQFEADRPLGSVRYKAGQILFQRGDLRGAEKVWAPLDEKSAGVYKKLAKEQIEHAQFKDDYKRYIDRIPAMEKMKQE